MNLVSNLSESLVPHQEEIFSTLKGFIAITPNKALPFSWWGSRIGGNPYLPKLMPYPCDSKGTDLFFLGQINFLETPSLESFPQKGILQFYIYDEGMYGLDLDNPTKQDSFRVVYIPDVIEDESALITDFSYLRSFDDTPLVSNQFFPLSFELSNAPVPTTDCAFDKMLGVNFFEKFGEEEWDVFEAYNKSISAAGHKIGGYAFFSQDDPRMDMEEMVLLFQLDTDEEIGCNWGDMGVANFFITKRDLENLDFSKVLYNWDCY